MVATSQLSPSAKVNQPTRVNKNATNEAGDIPNVDLQAPNGASEVDSGPFSSRIHTGRSSFAENQHFVDNLGQVIRVGDIIENEKGREGVVTARSGTGDDANVFVNWLDDDSRFEENLALSGVTRVEQKSEERLGNANFEDRFDDEEDWNDQEFSDEPRSDDGQDERDERDSHDAHDEDDHQQDSGDYDGEDLRSDDQENTSRDSINDDRDGEVDENENDDEDDEEGEPELESSSEFVPADSNVGSLLRDSVFGVNETDSPTPVQGGEHEDEEQEDEEEEDSLDGQSDKARDLDDSLDQQEDPLDEDHEKLLADAEREIEELAEAGHVIPTSEDESPRGEFDESPRELEMEDEIENNVSTQQQSEAAVDQVETTHELPTEVEEPQQPEQSQPEQEGNIMDQLRELQVGTQGIEAAEDDPERSGQENATAARTVERINRITDLMSGIDEELGGPDSNGNEGLDDADGGLDEGALDDNLAADIERLAQDQREETEENLPDESNLGSDRRAVQDLPGNDDSSADERDTGFAEALLKEHEEEQTVTGYANAQKAQQDSKNVESGNAAPKTVMEALAASRKTELESNKSKSSSDVKEIPGWADWKMNEQIQELEKVKAEARAAREKLTQSASSEDLAAADEEVAQAIAKTDSLLSNRDLAQIVVYDAIKSTVIKLTGISFTREDELEVLHSARSQVQSEAMDILGGYQFNSASPLPDQLLQKHSARSAEMTEEANANRFDSEHSLVEELEHDGQELDRTLEHQASKSSLSPSLKSMEELPLGEMFHKEVYESVMSKEERLASTLARENIENDPSEKEPEELLPSTMALIKANVIPDPKNESIRNGIPKAKSKAKLITRPKLPDYKGKNAVGEIVKEEEPEPARLHPLTGRPLARKNVNPTSSPLEPARNARSEPQSRIPAARQVSQSPSQGREDDVQDLSPLHNLDGDLIKTTLEKEVLDKEVLDQSRQGSRQDVRPAAVSKSQVQIRSQMKSARSISSGRGNLKDSARSRGIQSVSPAREEYEAKIERNGNDDFSKREFAKEFTARMRREKRMLAERKKQRVIQQDSVLMNMLDKRTDAALQSVDQSPPVPRKVRHAMNKRDQATGLKNKPNTEVLDQALQEHESKQEEYDRLKREYEALKAENEARVAAGEGKGGQPEGSGRQLIPISEVDESSPRRNPRSISVDSGLAKSPQRFASDDEPGSPPPLVPMSPERSVSRSPIPSGRRRSPTARSRGRQLSQHEAHSPEAKRGLALAPPGNADISNPKQRRKPQRPRSGRSLARAAAPSEDELQPVQPPPRYTRSVDENVGRSHVPLYIRMQQQREAEEQAEKDSYKAILLRRQMGPYMAQEVLPRVSSPGRTNTKARMHYATISSGPNSGAAMAYTGQPERLHLPKIHGARDNRPANAQYPYHHYKSSCKPPTKTQMSNYLLRKERPLRPGAPPTGKITG